MEDANKFIRKINSGNIDVFFSKRLNGNYHMVIGKSQEIRSGAVLPLGGFGGVCFANFGNLSFFISTINKVFNWCLNTKFTRI